ALWSVGGLAIEPDIGSVLLLGGSFGWVASCFGSGLSVPGLPPSGSLRVSDGGAGFLGSLGSGCFGAGFCSAGSPGFSRSPAGLDSGIVLSPAFGIGAPGLGRFGGGLGRGILLAAGHRLGLGLGRVGAVLRPGRGVRLGVAALALELVEFLFNLIAILLVLLLVPLLLRRLGHRGLTHSAGCAGVVHA